MRLLEAVPRSVLWLLDWNTWATQNLRREAGARGIDPGRLVFGRKLPLDAHLGRMGAADLFLDTLPYNAHTMGSDALWVGVPIVTCAGSTFASRVAGSLLTALGLPELIVGSLEEYEALALRLARAPGELSLLRDKLRGRRTSALLFDTPRFVRGLEEAYEAMWRNYLGGEGPRMIEV
jgi:predicted O-linked N-acetylglucosamine transferase (SPINDLY family)